MSKKNMKNKGKRPVNTSVTKPVSQLVQQNSKETDNLILKYLKKIFNIKVLSFIVATIAAVAGVIAIWPESKVDKIKKSIYNNIEKIELTIHPEKIPHELDSLHDVTLIKSFQHEILDCCTMWKSVESSKPYSDFTEEKKSQLRGILEFDRDATHKCIESMRKTMRILSQLKKYGEEKGIDNYSLINQSKLSNLYYQMELKDSIKNGYFDRSLEYVNKGKWKDGMKELDKIKKDANYYLFDDAYFDYVIELNDMFNISLRRYLN